MDKNTVTITGRLSGKVTVHVFERTEDARTLYKVAVAQSYIGQCTSVRLHIQPAWG